jgi:DNA topoisomerase-1
LAIIVRLIDKLSFRIGSELNVRRYHTYGLTTLRNRHLRVDGKGNLTFRFIGKHHILHKRVLDDNDLGAMVKEVRSLPGPVLFQYQDESGQPRPIRPRDVNQYIKDAMGNEFSARDFRVWAGTVTAAIELAKFGPTDKTARANRIVSTAMKAVAERLGNTPAVCRSAYVHPTIIKRFIKGITISDYQADLLENNEERMQAYDQHEAALLKLFSEMVKR